MLPGCTSLPCAPRLRNYVPGEAEPCRARIARIVNLKLWASCVCAGTVQDDRRPAPKEDDAIGRGSTDATAGIGAAADQPVDDVSNPEVGSEPRRQGVDKEDAVLGAARAPDVESPPVAAEFSEREAGGGFSAAALRYVVRCGHVLVVLPCART